MENINYINQFIDQEKCPKATVKECFNKHVNATWIVDIL